MKLRWLLCAFCVICFVAGSRTAAAAQCFGGTAGRIFFVTDREAVKGEHLFAGERAIGAHRLATVHRGTLGVPISARRRSDCRSQSEFLSSIGKSFDSKRGKQVLIYVHGYYTSFKAAAESALKLRNALSFPGPVVLYSWPSKVTSRLSYVNDETNASWSFVQFRVFLNQLESTYPGARISFAAHSLGARFVAEGVSYLRYSGCSKCVGRIALFAPDVDAATLYAEFSADKICTGSPKLNPATSAAVVLYVSNKDAALRQSQQFHGHQRAGQAGNEILLCDGIDTIDVSYLKISDRAGHSYQNDDRVLKDARASFAGVSPVARSRKLTKSTRSGAAYYELKQ